MANKVCATFRAWVALKATVIALVDMPVGGTYAHVLHDLIRWAGRTGDKHNERLLAVVGNRDGAQDPHIHWGHQLLRQNTGKENNIGTFFSRSKNCSRLFGVSSEEKNNTTTWAPTYPLLPMKVATKLAE